VLFAYIFPSLTQVYSASAVPKVAAFQRLKAKYGPRARYIALGSGFEEEAAAALMGWPFVRVVPGPQDQQAAAQDGAVGGAGTAAAGKGAGSSRAGGAAGTAGGSGGAAKRQKRSSGNGGKGDVTSDGDDGEEEEEEDDDDDDDDSTDTDEDGGGDGGRPKGVGGKGADGRMLGLDALGSRGHTMMELTAQQLKSLAMTMSLQ
jgi:hypothetical protein